MSLTPITLEIMDKIDSVRDELAAQIRVVDLPIDLAIDLRHSLEREIANCLDRYLAPEATPITPPTSNNDYPIA